MRRPLFAMLAIIASALPAQVGANPDLPAIAIIIDDIGYRHREDQAVIALPGPLAVAILPHSPHAGEMSELAIASGKEIMLHLPMEPERGTENIALGPGALTLAMDRVALMHTLTQNLRSVPSAVGVNNHMGSLLTRDTQHMQWLMESLRLRNLFFVDSVTSERSVAFDVAGRKGVPNLRRDVFLDNARDARNLQVEFGELIGIARRKGSALAIGHPHPETIALLRAQLPALDRLGVRLVSVSELLELGNDRMLVRALPAAGPSAGAGMR
ncbi:MAG: divergent polysaccharide deacetylase family protein [Gammaproteobacteria bacterium]|nr:divergent polysaccharide deacetylase family protein [Gammaproteobacteria bacterium]